MAQHYAKLLRINFTDDEIKRIFNGDVPLIQILAPREYKAFNLRFTDGRVDHPMDYIALKTANLYQPYKAVKKGRVTQLIIQAVKKIKLYLEGKDEC